MIDLNGNLRHILSTLKYHRVASFASGAATGSHLSLKANRSVQSASVASRSTKNDYGTIELYITCAWRIDSETSVLCGGWDDDDPSGAKLRTLNAIIGQSIRRVSIKNCAFDLVVAFANGYNLRIFCDTVNEEDAEDNYSLHSAAGTWIVGTKSKLRFEESRLIETPLLSLIR
jgi:hypothetical protein